MASIGSQIKICVEIGKFGVCDSAFPLSQNPVFLDADAFELKRPEYLPIIADFQRGEIVPDVAMNRKLGEVVASGKPMLSHNETVIDLENWRNVASPLQGDKNAISLMMDTDMAMASFHLGGSNALYWNRETAKRMGTDIEKTSLAPRGDRSLFRKVFMQTFDQRLKFIRQRYNGPVAFENVAFMPELLAVENVTEPWFISEVFSSYPDIHLLLDLAHASVTARRLRIKVEDYLSALPLSRVVEVHVSHSPALTDMHLAPTMNELYLLDFIRRRGAKPEYVTVEYWKDMRVLSESILILKNYMR